ncbi:MAG: hypothetical protein M0C28_31770 [Candidatus Moduliflexus flocculans]|nr:hypothetical protein [Candidatus Moduliflexus flocculans]
MMDLTKKVNGCRQDRGACPGEHSGFAKHGAGKGHARHRVLVSARFRQASPPEGGGGGRRVHRGERAAPGGLPAPEPLSIELPGIPGGRTVRVPLGRVFATRSRATRGGNASGCGPERPGPLPSCGSS